MTFVRIGEFRALPDKTKELRAIYENEAIPTIRAAQGNISAVLLQEHRAPDTFLAITIWQTAEDADRYDKSGQATAVVDKVRFGFAGPPSLSTYDAYGLAPQS